jgi:hypothetical protein
LWKEWTVGLSGCPSIQELEARDKKWRKAPTETRFFYRRELIIKFVKEKITGGLSAYDAVNWVDDYMKNNHLSSLNALSKHLCDRNKARQSC